MSSKPLKNILIIGGGLGGLALAQALRETTFNITIFERDAGSGGRNQGIMLGLNETGVKILHSLSIIPLCENFDRYASPHRSFKLVDQNFKKLLQFPMGGRGQGCSIDRWILRDYLLHDLERDKGEKGRIKIEWGKKFIRYEEEEEGVMVFFEDGSSVRGDLVIGCDGANSKVRKQRTNEIVLEELPVCNAAGSIPAPSPSIIPLFQSTVSHCMMRVYGRDGVTCLGMKYKNQEEQKEWILWVISFQCDEVPSEEQKMEVLAEKATHICPEIVQLVNMTPKESIYVRKIKSCRALTKNPLGKTTRVTLLGDAAHQMTTHGGLGANTAFMDARDLADALMSDEEWRTAIGKYEEKMLKRGYDAVASSRANTMKIITPMNPVKSWLMWTMGKFFGGESKIELDEKGNNILA